MRGWFASGLTKHMFTITPFITPCLCKTVFFGTSPWSLGLASKKAKTDSLRNALFEHYSQRNKTIQWLILQPLVQLLSTKINIAAQLIAVGLRMTAQQQEGKIMRKPLAVFPWSPAKEYNRNRAPCFLLKYSTASAHKKRTQRWQWCFPVSLSGALTTSTSKDCDYHHRPKALFINTLHSIIKPCNFTYPLPSYYLREE